MSQKKIKTLCYSKSKKNAWIASVSGTKIDIFNPKPEDLNIGDIAHALSMLCRFNGHCPRFYSVAQHSVVVSYICDPKYAFAALMHDTPEAITGDIIKPLKVWLPDFAKIEKRIEKCFEKAFNIDSSKKCKSAVKLADNIALVTEARDLLKVKDGLCDYADVEPMKKKIIPLSQNKSFNLFLDRFFELTGLTDKNSRVAQ